MMVHLLHEHQESLLYDHSHTPSIFNDTNVPTANFSKNFRHNFNRCILPQHYWRSIDIHANIFPISTRVTDHTTIHFSREAGKLVQSVLKFRLRNVPT